MNRRDRAALHDRHQRATLLGIQERRIARRLAVHQPGRPLSVEGQHPIPNRLKTNAADPRRLGPRDPVIDRRQRQQPTRLAGVLRPPRQPAQANTVVIPAKPKRSRHGNPHLFATVNHIRTNLGSGHVSHTHRHLV